MILAITGASGGTPLVPRIIAQPSATLTGYKNQSITIRVVAIGVSLQFQWYKGSDPISGATLTSLLLQNLQDSDQASYYCVVSNANGTLTSTSCALTVAEGLPTVTVHPQSQTVFEGQGLSLSVSATPPAGSTLAYMWQASDNNGVSWSNLGITSSTYSLPKAEMQIDGGQFRCRVTASQSGVAVFSDAATISVTQVFASQPQDIFGGIGDVVLSCELSQSRDCKLQRSFDGGQTFADVNVHYDGLTNVVTAQYNPTQQTGSTIELKGNPATPYISSTKYRIKVAVGSGQFTYSRNVDVNILLRPSSVSIKTPCRKGAVAELNQTIEDTTGLMFVWSYGDAGAEVASGRSQFSDQLTGTLPNDAYGTVRCSLNTAQTGTDRVSTAEVPALAAIEITSQPQDVTKLPLQTFELAVVTQSADNQANLTYSWTDGTTVYGTGRTLSVTPVSDAYTTPLGSFTPAEGDSWCVNGASLYCVISDTLGNSIQSRTVQVTISGTLAPVITSGFTRDVYISAGSFNLLEAFNLTATSPNAPTGRRDTGATESDANSSYSYMLSDYPLGRSWQKETDGTDKTFQIDFFNAFGETDGGAFVAHFGSAPSSRGINTFSTTPGGNWYPADGFAQGNAGVIEVHIGQQIYLQSMGASTGTGDETFTWFGKFLGTFDQYVPISATGMPSFLPSSSTDTIDSTTYNYFIILVDPNPFTLKLVNTNSWGSSFSEVTFQAS